MFQRIRPWVTSIIISETLWHGEGCVVTVSKYGTYKNIDGMHVSIFDTETVCVWSEVDN